ncbi:hypothetical protein BD310DRAFT_327874 [Dichomitus squalens]|uniref:DUF6535 domain-containing protein n=1 Tax=Dichomitus squalens TaxID=114155 RepID=A0A4Q9PAW5_9APHY|nr:hypothetical protein BD310DRAFT_327874 [Dichomitus squalens]
MNQKKAYQMLQEQIDLVSTEDTRIQAWRDAANVVKVYNDELVDQWNKEIDGLLTFAGLFSAVLTAFNVLAYPLLLPLPTDQTTAILLQISAQLSSFSVNPSFVNSTRPAFDSLPPPPPFQAPRYAVWLNSLWFISIVLSLASATIGIIVKQWLKEHGSGLYAIAEEIIRRRQDRLNNLNLWHVSAIVAVLPVLLLAALILFLVGMVVFLYNTNITVATVVVVPTAALFAFLAGTTLLPILFSSCCYHSPQARAASYVWKWTRPIVLPIPLWSLVISLGLVFVGPIFAYMTLSPQRKAAIKACFRALRDRYASFRSALTQMAERLAQWWSRWMAPTMSLRKWEWRGEESVRTTENPATFDGDMLSEAYTITLNSWDLERTKPFMYDLTRAPEVAARYMLKIEKTLKERWDLTSLPDDIRHRYTDLVAYIAKRSAWFVRLATPERGADTT